MSTILLTRFAGEAPRLSSGLLDPAQAEAAVNCNLLSGELRAFNASREVDASLSPPAATPEATWRALHLVAGRRWLAFTQDVDMARAPIAGDRLERTYFTGLDAPRVTDVNLLARGDARVDHVPSRLLGVPAPEIAPRVVAGPMPRRAAGERRSVAYCFVYVNGYAEQGPPGPPSPVMELEEGRPVFATVAEPARAELLAAHNVIAARVFRTNTAADGSGLWQFVGETPLTRRFFTDAMTDLDLGETLYGENWYPPPRDMLGLIALPGGMLAGFSGNELCFSEPYRPHAWPPEYRLTMDYPIVGLGVFGSSIVAATTAHPYVVTGADPLSMSVSRLPDRRPCLSKRGMAGGESGVVYPTPDGLFLVGPGGGRLLTRGLFTRDEWRRLGPRTMHATVHHGKYVAFFQPVERRSVPHVRVAAGRVLNAAPLNHAATNGGPLGAAEEADPVPARRGLIFDPAEPEASLVFLDEYSGAIYSDPESDVLYLTAENGPGAREWAAAPPEGGEEAPGREYLWRSKTFSIESETCMAAVKVVARRPARPDPARQRERAAARTAAVAANEALLAGNIDQGGALNASAVAETLAGSDRLLIPPTLLAEPSPIHFVLYAEGRRRATIRITDNKARRLPAGYRARSFQVEVRGAHPIERVMLAPSVEELTR